MPVVEPLRTIQELADHAVGLRAAGQTDAADFVASFLPDGDAARGSVKTKNVHTREAILSALKDGVSAGLKSVASPAGATAFAKTRSVILAALWMLREAALCSWADTEAGKADGGKVFLERVNKDFALRL